MLLATCSGSTPKNVCPLGALQTALGSVALTADAISCADAIGMSPTDAVLTNRQVSMVASCARMLDRKRQVLTQMTCTHDAATDTAAAIAAAAVVPNLVIHQATDVPRVGEQPIPRQSVARQAETPVAPRQVWVISRQAEAPIVTRQPEAPVAPRQADTPQPAQQVALQADAPVAPRQAEAPIVTRQAEPAQPIAHQAQVPVAPRQVLIVARQAEAPKQAQSIPLQAEVPVAPRQAEVPQPAQPISRQAEVPRQVEAPIATRQAEAPQPAQPIAQQAEVPRQVEAPIVTRQAEVPVALTRQPEAPIVTRQAEAPQPAQPISRQAEVPVTRQAEAPIVTRQAEAPQPAQPISRQAEAPLVTSQAEAPQQVVHQAAAPVIPPMEPVFALDNRTSAPNATRSPNMTATTRAPNATTTMPVTTTTSAPTTTPAPTTTQRTPAPSTTPKEVTSAAIAAAAMELDLVDSIENIMKRLNRKPGSGSSWAKNSQGARSNASGRGMPQEKLAQLAQQDAFDLTHGFAPLTEEDGPQIGWLLNACNTSRNVDNVERSGVELYFLAQDGSAFKTTLLRPPYFYVAAPPKRLQEALAYVTLEGTLLSSSVVSKEDLDLPNHLSGLQASYIQLVFRTVADLVDAKQIVYPMIIKNKQDPYHSTDIPLVDIRYCPEYDVTYLMRVAIDDEIRVGAWYSVQVDALEGVKVDRVRPFECINVANELELIRYFFNHVKELNPHIFVTYNGDFFDWPFLETRAQHHGMDLKSEVGISKDRNGEYRGQCAVHLDAYCWVKRDSYLPQGSQGLKAVTKYKLGYDPVEVDPEEMLPLAQNEPLKMASYSVSDAVATFYLYDKYVHLFVFSLCTIIPLGSEDVLRKGSGTLCEALLMVEAFRGNIICPNKQVSVPFEALEMLRDCPDRWEKPLIYHLDVAAMYPNIILTNRLQP
ncbi:hypothetical protein DYB37_001032, partial [Aphanomyces astaci]